MGHGFSIRQTSQKKEKGKTSLMKKPIILPRMIPEAVKPPMTNFCSEQTYKTF